MLKSARLFVLALVILLAPALLIYSAAVAQDEAEHPDGYYPTLALAELEPCRAQFAVEQADVVRDLRAQAAEYAPGGKYYHAGDENAARNVMILTDEANRDAAMDPLAWYARGIDGDGTFFGGMEMINDYADGVIYSNILKGLNQGGGPREALGLPYSDFGISEAHYYAAETCIANIWMGRFAAMHPELSQPSKSAALTAAQSELCTNDMYALAAVSQKWPGEVLDKAERLGKMQKDLFTGRCAEHPDAAKYIEQAENMMGPDETANWKPGGGDYIVPTRAELAAKSEAYGDTGSPSEICVGTPLEELAAFNSDMTAIQAQHPAPDEQAGARAIYQWTYAYSLAGLEKIEPHRICMKEYYAPNLKALEDAKVSAKSGCEALSSAGGECPKVWLKY